MRNPTRSNEDRIGATSRWRLAPLLAMLAGLIAPPVCAADWLLVGRIEAECIQSLTYGWSAFFRRAGFPYNLADMNRLVARRLAIPNLAGINLRERIVLHLLVDGDAPRATARVATLAILEPADNGATLLSNLDAVHARHEEQAWGVIFVAPREGFSGPDRLAVSLRGGKAYLSDTPDVIAWAMRPGRSVLTTAPAGGGQLLVTVHPSELNAYLSATNAALAAVTRSAFSLLPTGLVERAFIRLPDLIEDAESLSLSLNANGQALSATLNLSFKPASPRQARLVRTRPYERGYGALAPNAATLATVISQSGRGGWRELMGWTLAPRFLPTLDELVGENLVGDSLVYIDQTRTGDGIALVVVAKVIDPGEAHRRLIKNLDGRILPSGLSVLRAADRRHHNADIQCFSLTHSAADTTSLIPFQSSTLNALARLLTKNMVIETTVAGPNLALVVGPPGSIKAVIDNLNSGHPPYVALPERNRLLSQDAPADASSVTLLKPVALLRQIISTLPGYKSEQMATFALPGDGLFAWTRAKDGRYTGTLRIAANEVNALRNALTRGRPIIHELLLQMVMRQILNQP